MTTALDNWLKQATRWLSRDSAAQVREEIQAHYESAREAALSNGANAAEADRLAVAALGDARTANCQYRHVLLTSAEARMLREENWQAQAVCSRAWLKWALSIAPVTAMMGAVYLFLTGDAKMAGAVLSGAIGLWLVFAATFLPVYTPSRGRVFRYVRCTVLLATLVLALQWSWLLIACAWPLVWIEWRRISIRRKLPVDMWPKQLYL